MTRYKAQKAYFYLVLMALGLSALWARPSHSATLHKPDGSTWTTQKVSHIPDFLDPNVVMRAAEESDENIDLPGDRLVIINSDGGYTELADAFISGLEAEKKATDTRIICVVRGSAISMGFNLLSHCDERYATSGSKLMFHKVFVRIDRPVDVTAKDLRRWAEHVEKSDLPYAKVNRKALRMTPKQYDKYADDAKYWTPEELVKNGYLKGIVTLED